MTRICFFTLALLSLAAAQEPPDQQAVLELTKKFLANPNDLGTITEIFNNHQDALGEAYSKKLITDEQWAALRQGKLKVVSNAIQEFLTSQRGPKFGSWITRMDHMGSSGAVTDYTPTSDADLRPDHIYKGIEADFAGAARRHGIKDMKAWKINILGPTEVDSIESFLRASRNFEKYSLEGALRVLDRNQYGSNYTETVEMNPDGSPKLVDGRPVFKGKIKMTDLGLNVPEPTKMDLTDYTVEMSTRSNRDLKEIEGLKPNAPNYMAELRRCAKDIYKYSGTRGIDEVMRDWADIADNLDPDLRARLEEHRRRAKDIKSKPNNLGDNPEEIKAEVRRLIADANALMDAALKHQIETIAAKEDAMVRDVAQGKVEGIAERLNELAAMKTRLAIQIVRGGGDIEAIQKKYFEGHAELWKDVQSLKSYALEEFHKTVQEVPEDYDRTKELGKVRKEAADRFMENVLRKLQANGVNVDPHRRPLRRVELPKQEGRVPAKDVKNEGAAKIYEKYAKAANQRVADAIEKLRGNGKLWLPDVNQVLKELELLRNADYQSLLTKQFEQWKAEANLTNEKLLKLKANLWKYERGQILAALKKQWNELPPLDRNLIISGRTLVRDLVKVETPREALDKLFMAVMIWDIAYATYKDGWDGFWLSATPPAAVATALWFLTSVAPAFLRHVGAGLLANAAVGLGQVISLYLLVEGVIDLIKRGVEAAVNAMKNYFVIQPLLDANVPRFYGWHEANSREREEGFGFFDPSREGFGLTPKSLFRGTAERPGYASPEALLTAIRTHRAQLVRGKEVPRELTHGDGMNIWWEVEERALKDWTEDAIRTMDEIKKKVDSMKGPLKGEDINSLVATAEDTEKPVYVEIPGAKGRYEKQGDGKWRGTVDAILVSCAIPGARARLKIAHKIRGTTQVGETSLDISVGADEVDPSGLLKVEKSSVDLEFDKAGIFIDEIKVTDENDKVLAETSVELGVGFDGTIDELSVEVAQEREGPAVDEVRAAEPAYLRVSDRLTGFEVVVNKDFTAWLLDSDGKKLATAGGTAPRGQSPAVLALNIPDSVPPGEYQVKVIERLWKVEREAVTSIRVGMPKPRYANFQCLASTDAAGTPRTKLFRPGDYIYYRVEFDAKYVPSGTSASVQWTLKRPHKRPKNIPGGEFEVQEGHNGFTRPDPDRFSKSSDAGPYTLTATVTIEGESFTATTNFEVSSETLMLKGMFVTWKMDSDKPSETYAPGETVWGHVDYKLLGPEDSAQRVQAIWSLTHKGGEPRVVLRSTVWMTPGDRIALCPVQIPKQQRSLGRYSLEVSLRAERQEAVVSQVGFDVKKPIEWEQPELLITANEGGTVSLDDFRLGEAICATMKYKVNVENGRKVAWEFKTVGPDGAFALMTHSEPAKAAKIDTWRSWLPATLPSSGDALKPGKYAVTGRVTWGDEAIETHAAFHVYEPAIIREMTILESENSGNAKTKFKPGEPFGIWLSYSLQHLRENEKAKLTIDMYEAGGGASLWHKEWGPWDAEPVSNNLRVGGKFHQKQKEANYYFEAKLTVSNFTYTVTRNFRVEIFPEVIITSPEDGSETRERKITVTGTIADPRIQQATIALNGDSKALAVRDGKFAEKMVLRPGRNVITVEASNNSGTDSKTVTINADIPAATLKIVLDWSTDASDVDLWVVDPEGQTTSYHSMRPKPDRFLDVDNTDGFGPEVYTMFKKLKGRYTVIVKYFKDKGAGATTARLRWTAWEGTMWEQSGETSGTLTDSDGDKEKPGTAFRWAIEVP